MSSRPMNQWTKIGVCCTWLGAAVAADMGHWNVNGATRILTAMLAATSPIAFIWLIVLVRKMK